MHFWIKVVMLISFGYLGSLQALNAKNYCGCRDVHRRLDRLEREISESKRKVECPAGFVRSRSYCYLFMMSNKKRSDWGDAREYCKEHGANLVTIDNKKQEQFIKDHLKKNFYKGGPLKLFTGLIYTDSNAQFPHDPHNGQSRGFAEGNSFRWTATGRAINTSLIKYTPPRMTKWSPAFIQGLYTGEKGIFMSCVVLFWQSGKNSSIVWRFNSCYEEKLNFICEVRIPRETQPRQRKKRDLAYSRLSNNENTFSRLHEDGDSMELNDDVESFENDNYFDENEDEHGYDDER